MRLGLYVAVVAAGAGLASPSSAAEPAKAPAPPKAKYAEVALTSNLYGKLSTKEQGIVRLLIEACADMDAIFRRERYGDKSALLASVPDPDVDKPKGAGYYPADVTKAELDAAAAAAPQIRNPYMVVRRDAGGKLTTVWFHEAFPEPTQHALLKLRAAGAFAADPDLSKYLLLRSKALSTDIYQPSDLAWMDLKTNGVDVVIGPIEGHEDLLLGVKTSHQGIVLLKDKETSARLAKYRNALPDAQRGLPVPPEYKREIVSADWYLDVYDAVYFAGAANTGPKVISMGLPNDEQVQKTRGTRRLQFKNVMRAKFDKILSPIADQLIAQDSRGHVTFDAFLDNVSFHEVAHGIGIRNTINGKGTVKTALRDQAAALEEAKADVLGLYLIAKLKEKGELGGVDFMDNLVTYLTSLFGSLRAGTTDAQGRASLAEFLYFQQVGAIFRDSTTGTYRADLQNMRAAINSLAQKILKIQGDGSYEGAVDFLPKEGFMEPVLAIDLTRLRSASIPIDLTFKQGIEVLEGKGK